MGLMTKKSQTRPRDKRRAINRINETDTCKGIWALSALNYAYTGPLIRVRRSSDDTELDIAASVDGIDSASLLTFVGAGSGYVTKIYDQSGNGNHATQSTASYQPRIVNAGTIETDSNGDYSIYYDGTDDRLDVTDNSGLDINSGGLSGVVKYDPEADNGYILSRNGSANNDDQYAYLYIDVINTGFEQYLNGGTVGNKDGDLTKATRINVATYDDVNAKIYLNGILKDTNPYSTPLTSRSNMQIGCRSASADGSTKVAFLEMHCSDIMIFAKALTQSQVTTITNKL